jgi:putative transcriptional regulator
LSAARRAGGLVFGMRPSNNVAMKHAFESLRDHFLIAMPSLTQGIFAHSVTYVCEHSDSGAMGIVINQPLDLCLHDILQHLQIDGARAHQSDPIMAGGPVQTDRGFVLHRAGEREWESTLRISDEVALTTSRDILAAIAHDEGPAGALLALGYAGWSAGQLEGELAANAWLTLPADSAIIFNTPIARRLDAAAARLGIDLARLAPGAGHA